MARGRAPKLAAWAMLACGIALGCEAIVGDDVPTFHCASDVEGTCPSGQVCDLTLGRCVRGVRGGDADAEAIDAGGPVDATDAGDAGPLALGAPCRVDDDCASHLCGTSNVLTTVVTDPAGPVCTSTCCTSADCPSGFVCYGAGTGGNYCVVADLVGRTPAVGVGAAAGAPCTSSGDCRSGYCEASRCIDTCCKAGDCASGTTCRLTTVKIPAPNREDWACAPPVSPSDAGVGDSCSLTNGPVCSNNACFGSGATAFCRAPCCGTDSCTAAGYPNGRCRYGTSLTGDSVKICFSSASGSAVGTTCTNDSECASGYCDLGLKTCAMACCTDPDCPGGQVCRPAAAGPPRLRCVGRE